MNVNNALEVIKLLLLLLLLLLFLLLLLEDSERLRVKKSQ